MEYLTIEYYRQFLNDCANYLFSDDFIEGSIQDIKEGYVDFVHSVNFDNECALHII
jgi:hypothetical protein